MVVVADVNNNNNLIYIYNDDPRRSIATTDTNDDQSSSSLPPSTPSLIEMAVEKSSKIDLISNLMETKMKEQVLDEEQDVLDENTDIIITTDTIETVTNADANVDANVPIVSSRNDDNVDEIIVYNIIIPAASSAD